MKKITLLACFITQSAAFSQTSCNNAIAVTLGEHSNNLITNTTPLTTPCSGNLGTSAQGTSWYVFTPTTSGYYTISTDINQNSGLDTRFHLYTGTCSNLACFGGDDDSGSGNLSHGSYQLTANTSYYIVFDNAYNANNFLFRIAEDPNGNFNNSVTFTNQNISASGTTSIAAFDANNDGLDDIVQISSGLLRIRPQVANSLDFAQSQDYVINNNFLPTWSLAAGDLNKDGINDIVLGGGNGVSILISDTTNNSYSTINSTSYIFSQRTNMIDLNNDGHLDTFICHDVAPNTYYLNDGTNNFNFFQGGIGDHPNGGNYGSIWVDYDNDNLPDLFLAKCRGGSSTAKLNQLFKNNGDGTFTEVSVEANMNHPNQNWSSAWGDFDNDGDMDAFLGASSLADGGHLLMRNNGDGTFTDIISTTTIDPSTSLGQEYVAADINNDGWIDILTASNIIYYNNADGTFTPFRTIANFGAVADLNNDGFLDFYNHSSISYNNGNDNNWLKIKLVGTNSNKNGIGARIEIFADNTESTWQKQIRDVRSGEGFRYMGTINSHFGLGQETSIDRLVIHWPSGLTEQVNNPQINTLLTLTEGTLLNNNEVVNGEFKLYPNPSSDYIYLQTNNDDILNFEIYDLGGRKIMFGIYDEKIDISNMSTGTYIMNLSNKTNKKSLKFVKK